MTSILEIDAASIHAHWVDAAQDEHAVVYHDLVADFHAAEGGTRPPVLPTQLRRNVPRPPSLEGVFGSGRGRAIDDGAPGPPPSFTRPESAHGPAGSAVAHEPKDDMGCRSSAFQPALPPVV